MRTCLCIACLFIVASELSLRAESPPDFIMQSTAPAESRVQITGFMALVIPAIEADLDRQDPSFYIERLDSLLERQIPDNPDVLIRQIDEALFQHRGHWQSFELAVDDEKRRLEVFDQSGKALQRDVAFDGKTEVQYAVDSEQANVFLKRSPMNIPSFSNFFPLSATGAKSISWTDSPESSIGDFQNMKVTAVPDGKGYIKRTELGRSQIVTLGWKKTGAGFPIPRVQMNIVGSAQKTESIRLTIVETCELGGPLTAEKLAVKGYAGTNVFLGGFGQPAYSGRKLLDQTDNLATYARKAFSVPE